MNIIYMQRMKGTYFHLFTIDYKKFFLDEPIFRDVQHKTKGKRGACIVFESHYFRVSDIAAALGLSTKTVRSYCKRGLLPFIKVNRIMYIRADHFHAFMNEYVNKQKEETTC